MDVWGIPHAATANDGSLENNKGIMYQIGPKSLVRYLINGVSSRSNLKRSVFVNETNRKSPYSTRKKYKKKPREKRFLSSYSNHG